MDAGLIVTFAGIFVAALAGVLGVWMERDQEAPARWAWVFTVCIVACSGIEAVHSLVQTAEDGATEEALARVLDTLSTMAAKGDNPALEQFVGAELAVQARANPQVMKRLEKKVAAKGGDPKELRSKAKAASRTAAGLPKKAPPKATKDGKGGAGKAGAGKAGAGKAGDGKAGAGKGEAKAGEGPGSAAKTAREGAGAAAAAGLGAAAKGEGGAAGAAAKAAGIKTDGGAASTAKSAAEAAGVKTETTEKAAKATDDASKAAKAAAKGDASGAAKSASDLASGLTKGKTDTKKDDKKDEKKGK